VNDDGFDDFVVSAHRNDDYAVDAGRVYVFLGGDGPFPVTLERADARYVLNGETEGDAFGSEINTVRDLDGDGVRELLVGAFWNDAVGVKAGAAYLFSGARGTPIHAWYGEAAYDQFGCSVADAGDVNDDGVTDVIVGAEFNDAGGDKAGRAYVYSGADASLLYRVTGEGPDDQFGTAVAGLEDVDDDGYGDWLVGASGHDAGGDYAGRAYVFHGGPGPYHVEVAAGDADLMLTGSEPYDRLGRSVSGIEDQDGDGLPDLVVSASEAAATGRGKTGAVGIYSGETGERLRAFSGEMWEDSFGFIVHADADIDRDGAADLIVGANFADAGGVDAGRVYVYLLGDQDDDGFPAGCDNCPEGYNPDQQPVVFGQEILATDAETFAWTTPADVDWVRGDLASVSVYGTDAGGALDDADTLVDSDQPGGGEGSYYLVKLGGSCEAASWQSSQGAEPERDVALP
jgi:hypothetical protein